MDNRIGATERLDGLSEIGQIRNKRRLVRVKRCGDIDRDNVVAVLVKVGNDGPASLSTPAGHYHTLHDRPPCSTPHPTSRTDHSPTDIATAWWPRPEFPPVGRTSRQWAMNRLEKRPIGRGREINEEAETQVSDEYNRDAAEIVRGPGESIAELRAARGRL